MIRKMTANGALRDDLLQRSLDSPLADGARPRGQTGVGICKAASYHLMHYLSAAAVWIPVNAEPDNCSSRRILKSVMG